jgi:hypothetical protein
LTCLDLNVLTTINNIFLCLKRHILVCLNNLDLVMILLSFLQEPLWGEREGSYEFLCPASRLETLNQKQCCCPFFTFDIKYFFIYYQYHQSLCDKNVKIK